MQRRQCTGSGDDRLARCGVLALLAFSLGAGGALSSPPPAPTEILLTGSPAAAPVLAAVLADLRRTPLRHAVRPAPCADAAACQAWLDSPAPPGLRAVDRILAVLDLDLSRSGGALLSASPVRRDEQLVFPPGWLVHAVLRSADAVGRPLAFAGVHYPFLTQLVARGGAPVAPLAASERTAPFLAQGVPAAGLAAPPGEAAELLAAAVRRLDRLPGRPVEEGTYLVAFGRVWLRRDLYWVGFLLWVLLVLRGRPGRWRGTDREERQRRGRAYRPAFAFRLLFLAAVLLSPIFAVLLWPAGLLALAPPGDRSRRSRRLLWAGLALLPVAVFTGAFVLAFARHQVAGWGAGPLQALLPLTALAAYLNQMALAADLNEMRPA